MFTKLSRVNEAGGVGGKVVSIEVLLGEVLSFTLWLSSSPDSLILLLPWLAASALGDVDLGDVHVPNPCLLRFWFGGLGPFCGSNVSKPCRGSRCGSKAPLSSTISRCRTPPKEPVAGWPRSHAFEPPSAVLFLSQSMLTAQQKGKLHKNQNHVTWRRKLKTEMNST